MAKINIPGPKVGYVDLQDAAITQELERKKKEYKDKGTTQYYPLRPSAAGKCARELAYDLMEYMGHAFYDRPVIEPNVYRLFKHGGALEWAYLKNFELVTVINQRYRNHKLHVFELEKLDEETRSQILEGECDFCFINEKWKCIGDVKTTKDKFSVAYKTKWEETLEKYENNPYTIALSDKAWFITDLEKFMDTHNDVYLRDNLLQLNTYACSEFMKKTGIDHAIIVKYNKNDSRHYELRFQPNQKLAGYVKKKFEDVKKKVKVKAPEEVKQEFPLGSMRCAFCPHRTRCWPYTDATKEWFRTLPRKKWPINISEVDHSEELEKLFESYEADLKAVFSSKTLEERILSEMVKAQVNKIRLKNGNIYEIKQLKSPKPHLELRRSKL